MKFTEQETQDLLQKAQSIGQFMHFEDSVLPLVDYFAIGDLIENKEYKLANSMGQALIGTVNSVCGKLLVRYAFEAGLSP